MSVIISSVVHFVGLSTDVKPQASAGSTFWETDTGLLYESNSLAWTQKDTTVKMVAGNALVGKVGIDQVTANANEVVVKSVTAGENHMGEVGGNGKSVTVTLTVTNGAYTLKDVAGGLITFANAVRGNGKHAIVNSIKLDGVVANAYNLHFLNADLATPAADNAPFTLAAGDLTKLLGWVPIQASDYAADASAGFNMATVRNVGLQVKAAAGTTSIYAYLVAQATTSPGTTTVQLICDFEYLD